jgi:hypothetical protein
MESSPLGSIDPIVKTDSIILTGVPISSIGVLTEVSINLDSNTVDLMIKTDPPGWKEALEIHPILSNIHG